MFLIIFVKCHILIVHFMQKGLKTNTHTYHIFSLLIFLEVVAKWLNKDPRLFLIYKYKTLFLAIVNDKLFPMQNKYKWVYFSHMTQFKDFIMWRGECITMLWQRLSHFKDSFNHDQKMCPSVSRLWRLYCMIEKSGNDGRIKTFMR